MGVGAIRSILAGKLFLPHHAHDCLVIAIGVPFIIFLLLRDTVEVAVWKGVSFIAELMLTVGKMTPRSSLTAKAFYEVLAEGCFKLGVQSRIHRRRCQKTCLWTYHGTVFSRRC